MTGAPCTYWAQLNHVHPTRTADTTIRAGKGVLAHAALQRTEALTVAAAGRMEVARLLARLDDGAKQALGTKLLLVACSNLHADIASMLLMAGAEVNMVLAGVTALHIA